ncbi:MAG: M48 family metalloprotease [bacterium]|nr:M48 family metalloprotease [bacterium]
MNLGVTGSLLHVPAAAWLAFIMDLAVRSTLLTGAALLGTRALRNSPAILRSGIWTTTFSLLLALPLLTALPPVTQTLLPAVELPRLAVTQVPPVEIAAPILADEPVSLTDRNTNTPIQTTPSATANDSVPPTILPVRHLASWPVLVWTWLAVALFMTCRTLTRLLSGLRAPGRAAVVAGGPTLKLVRGLERDLHIRRPVQVRSSEEVTMPFVAGLIKRRLVLPAGILSWKTESLRSVLLHELAHIKRQDIARLIVLDLVRSLCWFNPLVWIGVRRATLAIEMACDDIVCRDTRTTRDYARQLLWFARLALGGNTNHLPGFARKIGLELRIENILQPGFSRDGSRGLSVLRHCITTLMILLALPLLLLQTETTQRVVFAGAAPPQTSTAVSQPDPTVTHYAPLSPSGIRPKAFVTDRGRRFKRINLTAADMLAAGNLISAAAAGNLSVVREVLESNPHLVNVQDDYGMTPVAQASWNDHLTVVDYLARQGANLEIKNQIGLTPLFCTLDRTRSAMATLLIRHGADINTHGYRNRTLLHMAARSGQVEIARHLIDRGAEINALDAMGATPYALARAKGDPGLLRLLRAHGARTSV